MTKQRQRVQFLETAVTCWKYIFHFFTETLLSLTDKLAEVLSPATLRTSLQVGTALRFYMTGGNGKHFLMRSLMW